MSKVRADNYSNRLGTGAPVFPDGINVTGVITATTFDGNATTATTSSGLTGTPDITINNITGVAATFSGNVSIAGTLTYEDVTNVDSIGLVTARSGIQVLTGGISVDAGITTLTTLIPGETRFKSVAEEIKVGTATSVTIDFDAGDGNIGIVTAPSGAISLHVNDIPTSNFTNKAISLTVVVNQGATGYACSDVYFNGTQKTIRWSGGTVGAGNTDCIDYFNFVGIDTVGDGAIASYIVTGNVNGDYRFY